MAEAKTNEATTGLLEKLFEVCNGVDCVGVLRAPIAEEAGLLVMAGGSDYDRAYAKVFLAVLELHDVSGNEMRTGGTEELTTDNLKARDEH